MKLIIAIAVIAGAGFYVKATNSAKKAELVGLWRTRIVHAGFEVLSKLDLKESGEIVYSGAVTPLDPTLVIAGCTGPDGRPARTFNIEAKGEWSVGFNGLRAKFNETNPRCILPLDELYGGKIVSIEPKKLVLRPNSKQDRPAGMETEMWFR